MFDLIKKGHFPSKMSKTVAEDNMQTFLGINVSYVCSSAKPTSDCFKSITSCMFFNLIFLKIPMGKSIPLSLMFSSRRSGWTIIS